MSTIYKCDDNDLCDDELLEATDQLSKKEVALSLEEMIRDNVQTEIPNHEDIVAMLTDKDGDGYWEVPVARLSHLGSSEGNNCYPSIADLFSPDRQGVIRFTEFFDNRKDKKVALPPIPVDDPRDLDQVADWLIREQGGLTNIESHGIDSEGLATNLQDYFTAIGVHPIVNRNNDFPSIANGRVLNLSRDIHGRSRLDCRDYAQIAAALMDRVNAKVPGDISDLQYRYLYVGPRGPDRMAVSNNVDPMAEAYHHLFTGGSIESDVPSPDDFNDGQPRPPRGTPPASPPLPPHLKDAGHEVLVIFNSKTSYLIVDNNTVTHHQVPEDFLRGNAPVMIALQYVIAFADQRGLSVTDLKWEFTTDSMRGQSNQPGS